VNFPCKPYTQVRGSIEIFIVCCVVCASLQIGDPRANGPYSTSTDPQFRKLSLSERARNTDRPTIASVEDNKEVKVHPRNGEYIYPSTLSLASVLGGGGWSTPRPGHFTPGKETRYPLYRRLGEPQAWSGRLQQISPKTLQPLASRYTDYAILAHMRITCIKTFVRFYLQSVCSLNISSGFTYMRIIMWPIHYGTYMIRTV
jgi:hypothetical protein